MLKQRRIKTLEWTTSQTKEARQKLNKKKALSS